MALDLLYPYISLAARPLLKTYPVDFLKGLCSTAIIKNFKNEIISRYLSVSIVCFEVAVFFHTVVQIENTM